MAKKMLKKCSDCKTIIRVNSRLYQRLVDVQTSLSGRVYGIYWWRMFPWFPVLWLPTSLRRGGGHRHQIHSTLHEGMVSRDFATIQKSTVRYSRLNGFSSKYNSKQLTIACMVECHMTHSLWPGRAAVRVWVRVWVSGCLGRWTAPAAGAGSADSRQSDGGGGETPILLL